MPPAGVPYEDVVVCGDEFEAGCNGGNVGYGVDGFVGADNTPCVCGLTVGTFGMEGGSRASGGGIAAKGEGFTGATGPEDIVEGDAPGSVGATTGVDGAVGAMGAEVDGANDDWLVET